MMLDPYKEKTIILDFISQYTQLIAPTEFQEVLRFIIEKGTL